MNLISIDDIDNFDRIRDITAGAVRQSAITTVRKLDEADEMEPWLQAILYDTNHTAHGPAEIVDILTHKLRVNGRHGLAGFILKGKSFPTVRPKHVSHQIFRLERIKGIKTIVFAASGNVLDEVKEQLASTADRLGAGLCILDSHDLARLFVAFGYLCPRDGEMIRGGKCHCGYSPTTRTSNILQQDALRALQAAHELGQRAGAIIMPTGAGKTRVASIDAHRTDAKYIIYVAHSHEILMDAESEFLRTFPASEVTRLESGSQHDLSRVNLVTIQTLSRNLDKFGDQQVDYMIVDEFHHANAKSYRASILALQPRFLLGLTATPFRGDRKDVLENCDHNVIVNFELRHGIELGVLCHYHYFGCFDNIDYTKIKHNGTKYDVKDLEKALIIPERDAAIVEKWIEKSEGKATLAFCCSHLHARRVADSFQRSGISSTTYLSSTPYKERAQLRKDFEFGSVKVLCVVDVFNEGVDLPFAECLLFLRCCPK